MTRFAHRLWMRLVLVAGLAEWTAIHAAADEQPNAPSLSDSESKALALDVQVAAASVDMLPQFHYGALSGNGVVDKMREMDELSLAGLKQAIDGKVEEQDWLQWRVTLAWNERQALWSHADQEGRAFNSKTSRQDRVWRTDQAFERGESDGQPARFVFVQTPQRLWNGCLRELAYFRVAPHRFWWATSNHHNDRISPVPSEQASYRFVVREPFDDELCDVIESAERAERLWIGHASGRLRGVLTCFYRGTTPIEPFYTTEQARKISGRSFSSQQEFQEWSAGISAQQSIELTRALNEAHFASYKPNELIRFRDYREVAPGVWIPFREDRAFTHSAGESRNRFKYIRLWVAVQDARTDVDLTDTIEKLQPEDGEQIQDQRFGVVVSYKFLRDRTQGELLELVDAQRQKQAAGDAALQQIVAPIEELVGKAAPELPVEGWIGGNRPELAGKPYLLHFWATWCGPCKNDLPRLKEMASQGVQIIGIHPAGTPAEDVGKVINDQELDYPTWLASAKTGEGERKIGGYPAGVFPYCVIVDGKGRVAGHGSLGPELVAKLHALAK
jgi:thiol-disulfide isomerase/thioredoxin